MLHIHNYGAVPEAIRDTFFEKYATAGKPEGTGLGTYSARLMARIQEGDILMRTSEREGTTLTWQLRKAPASEVFGSAEQTDKTDSLEGMPAPEWPPLKVLVVDDDEYNLLVMRRYLPTPPLQVETAINGRAALDLADLNPPDVIFMDLEMPVMNGFEATASLRAREQSAQRGRCVIIGLSAHDDEETRRRSLDVGCDLYLRKPVTKEDLRRALVVMAGPGIAPQPQSVVWRVTPEAETPTPLRAEDAVYVDIDLRDTLPSFLQSRCEAVDTLEQAYAAGNPADVRKLAHRLTGSFALYGFRWAADHCKIIEREAEGLGQNGIEERLASLRHHLRTVPIIFADLSAGSAQSDHVLRCAVEQMPLQK